MRFRFLIVLSAAFALATQPAFAAIEIVDFEDVNTFTGTNPAGGGSFYNGNNGSGASSDLGWNSRGVHFSNNYDGSTLPLFDSWSGWGYSNVVNPSTSGFGNQYASFAGGGSNGAGGTAAGENYAIAFGNGYINIPDQYFIQSLDITNTAYAGLSMQTGDMFAKKFGGLSGNDPDLFQITFTGYDALERNGTVIGAVDVALADFRFADNSLDFILNQWRTVDLSSLAGARSIGFSFFSTDVGSFGINTPLYAAVDNVSFTVVPEPHAFMLTLAVMGLGLFRRKS